MRETRFTQIEPCEIGLKMKDRTFQEEGAGGVAGGIEALTELVQVAQRPQIVAALAVNQDEGVVAVADGRGKDQLDDELIFEPPLGGRLREPRLEHGSSPVGERIDALVRLVVLGHVVAADEAVAFEAGEGRVDLTDIEGRPDAAEGIIHRLLQFVTMSGSAGEQGKQDVAEHSRPRRAPPASLPTRYTYRVYISSAVCQEGGGTDLPMGRGPGPAAASALVRPLQVCLSATGIATRERRRRLLTMPASIPYEIGATVYARDGAVGPLDAVVAVPGETAPDRLIVRGRNRHFDIPLDVVDAAASSPSEIHLTVPRAALAQLDASAPGTPADHVVVPVREETLIPTTRPVKLGDVLIHKRVATVPYEEDVELAHEEVSIERVPINRPVETAPQPRYEGDTLIVPVVEEVLVTEKRLMLREELRIARRTVTETTPIRDTLRREVVDIEGRGSVQVVPPDETAGTEAASDTSG